MLNRIACLALTTLFLVGCGKSDEQKAEDTARSANEMISELNNVNNSLRSSGITLLRWGTGCDVSPNLNAQTKVWALGQLDHMISLSNQILAAGDAEGVFLSGRSSIEDARSSANVCKSRLR